VGFPCAVSWSISPWTLELLSFLAKAEEAPLTESIRNEQPVCFRHIGSRSGLYRPGQVFPALLFFFYLSFPILLLFRGRFEIEGEGIRISVNTARRSFTKMMHLYMLFLLSGFLLSAGFRGQRISSSFCRFRVMSFDSPLSLLFNKFFVLRDIFGSP